MRSKPETERKYEADPGTGLPELPGVVAGPQQITLDAVYYDTPDLKLIRSGLTLRRREGGDDEGWHLKVPVAEDTREEIHLPLNAKTTPPKEFTDLTLGYTRGAEVAPVARIRTDRTRWEIVGEQGKPRAEVTNDEVTASRTDEDSTTWREIEVEGEPAAIEETEKVLRSAGFRRSSASSKLARVLAVDKITPVGPDRESSSGKTVMAYITEQVEKIKHYDILVRQGVDDSVHQMRVTTRRLRSTLRVYRRLLASGSLADELQWLGQRLSTARDLEVQYARIRDTVAQLPTELAVGPVQARLTRYFAPEQEKARKNVLKTLRTKRYLALLDRLDALVDDPPLTENAARKGRKELPKHLDHAERKIGKRLRAGDVHRARKAAKRLRYALESAVPVLGEKADKARKRAKRLTKQGGEYQDAVVAQPLLRTLGMQAHAAGENGFTFGLLYGREEANAERAHSRMR
ncbi:MAG: CYTH and CHAD domain-containing protein [Kibdelosporangium sp.]